MKVILISDDPAYFNEKSALRAHARAEAAAIGEMHVIAHAPRGTAQCQDGSLHLHPVSAWPYLHFVEKALIKRTKEVAAEHGIRVISADDPFERGMIALRVARELGAKLHVQVRTDFLSPWFVLQGTSHSPQIPVPHMNEPRLAMADTVLKAAHGATAVSERVKQSLVERYGEKFRGIAVVPVPVSPDIPTPERLPYHEFTFALVTAGRLEPEKRVEDIIAALAQLKAKYPSLGLFVIGDGSRRKSLEKQVKELGLEERVVFTGWREDVRALMRAGQAYIQAPAYEGYGPTLVEAALARIPIITTDVGIVGEVFKGYEDVLALPPADPAGLAFAISALLEDVATRMAYVRSAEIAARAHLAKYPDIPALLAADLARLEAPAAPASNP